MSQAAEAYAGIDPLEIDLETKMLSFRHDPEGFVDYAYPWGEGELEGASPRKWQRDVLQEIGGRLKASAASDNWDVIQEAVASGHGIGKSALVAWLIDWAMSTRVDTRGIVTANTDTQLRTKTWPEVAKWRRLSITAHWFELTATRLSSVDPEHADNWRIDIIPWSEHNTEAFAGLHNKGRRIIVIFDESSAIHDKIWEVTEGALTDDKTEIVWFAPGNPTRQNGRFRDCFGRLAHRWGHRNIDSRTVEGTNKTQLDKWVEDNGEDSDFVRVRVRGEFPLQSEYQLISQLHVSAARKREAAPSTSQPLIAGLDLARSGACETVLAFRCGRDARSFVWYRWRERDSNALVGKIAKVLDELRAKKVHVHTIFGDGGGLGGPILDDLKAYGYPVREVLFGSGSSNPADFKNKGSEMWASMRDWMPTGAIPDWPDLEDQLVSRDCKYDPRSHQLSLVPKDQMLNDGLPSPDLADALALTFAYPIAPKLDVLIAGNRDQCLNDL